MDRSQLIEVIKQHKNATSDRDVENFADHLLAVIHVHYETLETKLRVKELTLSSFGINRD